MKIIVYTITDCQFSKQEKDYLNTNKLIFEEKNLETNREFLTEMLTLSNNFAGTPVTKIEKDDGQIAVLKGFTKEEFDKVLGLNQPAPIPQPTVAVAPPPATPPPVAPSPIPQPEAPPPVIPTSPVVEPPTIIQPEIPPADLQTPAVPITPTAPVVPPVQPQPPVVSTQTPTEDPLSSILNNLQAQTGSTPPTSANNTPPTIPNL